MESTKIECGYSKEQGKLLVLLARVTIGERLGIGFEDSGLEMAGLGGMRQFDFKRQLEHEAFSRRQGVFVTLEIDGRLRGCIGSLTPDGTVRMEVTTNALNAAFNDPRFPELTKDEFARVDLSVSILSNPEPLSFRTPEELVKKLVPAKDGVVVQKGRARATFLPQVWDQLPVVSEFLAHLCTKAGLAPDEWTRPGLEVKTYRVQHFS